MHPPPCCARTEPVSAGCSFLCFWPPRCPPWPPAAKRANPPPATAQPITAKRIGTGTRQPPAASASTPPGRATPSFTSDDYETPLPLQEPTPPSGPHSPGHRRQPRNGLRVQRGPPPRPHPHRSTRRLGPPRRRGTQKNERITPTKPQALVFYGTKVWNTQSVSIHAAKMVRQAAEGPKIDNKKTL